MLKFYGKYFTYLLLITLIFLSLSENRLLSFYLNISLCFICMNNSFSSILQKHIYLYLYLSMTTSLITWLIIFFLLFDWHFPLHCFNLFGMKMGLMNFLNQCLPDSVFSSILQNSSSFHNRIFWKKQTNKQYLFFLYFLFTKLLLSSCSATHH